MKKFWQKTIEFLKDVKKEMVNVTWPTRKEIVDYTVVAFIAMLITAIFLWIVDTTLSRIFSFIARIFT